MNNMKSILWGVVLVLLGVLVGTNSLGITNIDIFFDGWWSLFIIIPCFIGLFSNEDKTGNIIGLLVGDRKSTRLNSSHSGQYRMPSSA